MCYKLVMTETFVACGHVLVRLPYTSQQRDGYYLTPTAVSSTATVPIALEARTIPAKSIIARPFASNCTSNLQSDRLASFRLVLGPKKLLQSGMMVNAHDAAGECLWSLAETPEIPTRAFLASLMCDVDIRFKTAIMITSFSKCRRSN
jgi:GH24 family phage-related lysozyme (muramidase)